MWRLVAFSALFLVNCSNGAPAETPPTMYEALVQKCPEINNTNVKKYPEFSNCTDFAKINATKEYSSDREQDLRCLMLYDALVSFCGEVSALITIIPSIADLKPPNVNISSLCGPDKSMFPDNKKFEHNLTDVIYNDMSCIFLCADRSNKGVSNYCKLAYLFATFNTTKLQDALPVKAADAAVQTQPVKAAVAAPGDKNIPVKEQVNIENIQQVPKQEENLVDDDKNHKQVLDKEPKKDPVVEPAKPEADVKVKPNESKVEVPKVTTAKTVAPNAVDVKGKDKNIENVEDQVDNAEDQQFDDEDDDQEPEYIKKEPIMPEENDNVDVEIAQTKQVKPHTLEDEPISSFDATEEMNGDSYFFSYFVVMMCLVVVGYVGYHNRQKVLALLLEGKKGRRATRSRRPNSANYHKLDSNLEEAISSSCTKSATNVIY